MRTAAQIKPQIFISGQGANVIQFKQGSAEIIARVDASELRAEVA
jgi:hypothetical protein